MKTNKIKVVIVEDDLYYNKVLTKYVKTVFNSCLLHKDDFEIRSYLNAHECIENLEDDTNIMILDYYLINENEKEELSGADVLKEVKKHCPQCKVIVISAQTEPNIAVELMKQGIYEYVDKNTSTGNRVGNIIQKILVNEYSDQLISAN